MSMGENWGGEIYIPVPGGETGGIYVEVGELATMNQTASPYEIIPKKIQF